MKAIADARATIAAEAEAEGESNVGKVGQVWNSVTYFTLPKDSSYSLA